MKTTIDISSNALHAVNLFTSKDSSRYVLNGVYAEIGATHTILVATDGRMLFALRFEVAAKEPVTAIIPSSLIAYIKKGKDRILTLAVEAHEKDTGIEITDHIYGITYAKTAIEEQFPAWRKAVPSKESTHPKWPVRYNSQYLETFSRAAKLLGVSNPMHVCATQEDRDATAIIECGVKWSGLDVLALLMSVRADKETDTVKAPEWAIAK